MRIRTIKPEFWQSEDLANVSDKAKLLAIGLLNISDDEGYLKAHPAVIKSQIFPFIEESVNIQGLLIELSNANYLTLLDGDDGKQYVLIDNFTKHQKVNRPTPSKIRGTIEFTEISVSNHAQLTIGKERKGTGKGKEQGKEVMPNKFDDDVIQIFNNWVSVMQKGTSTKLTKERRQKIIARLKDGYTVDQIKQAVLGCSMTPHNMGKNENSKLYNDIELICRSATNLERFASNTQQVTHQPQQFSSVTQQNIQTFAQVELK